jgi:hypothetical protein
MRLVVLGRKSCLHIGSHKRDRSLRRFSRSWKAAVGRKSRCAITFPRFSPGLPISLSDAFQALLPQCGSPSIHSLKRRRGLLFQLRITGGNVIEERIQFLVVFAWGKGKPDSERGRRSWVAFGYLGIGQWNLAGIKFSLMVSERIRRASGRRFAEQSGSLGSNIPCRYL